MENGKGKSRKRIDRLHFKIRIIDKEKTREKGMISQLLIASDREEDIDKFVRYHRRNHTCIEIRNYIHFY